MSCFSNLVDDVKTVFLAVKTVVDMDYAKGGGGRPRGERKLLA